MQSIRRLENEFLYKMDKPLTPHLNPKTLAKFLQSMQLGDSFEIGTHAELNRVYSCVKKMDQPITLTRRLQWTGRYRLWRIA